MLSREAGARVDAAPPEAAPQFLKNKNKQTKTTIAGGLRIKRYTTNRYTYRYTGRCIWIQVYVCEYVFLGHRAAAQAYKGSPEASRRSLKTTSTKQLDIEIEIHIHIHK